MPDNWVPSDPASPQEIGKALLVNGPGMDDPIARAYIQRLQGQQGLNIEDMVRGTSPSPPPVTPPQQGAIGALFGVPAQHLSQLPHLAGDVVPLPQYPGLEFNRRAGMEQLIGKLQQQNPGTPVEKLNKALDNYFGGGAKILNFPGTTPNQDLPAE